jgi:hypothetical protein
MGEGGLSRKLYRTFAGLSLISALFLAACSGSERPSIEIPTFSLDCKDPAEAKRVQVNTLTVYSDQYAHFASTSTFRFYSAQNEGLKIVIVTSAGPDASQILAKNDYVRPILQIGDPYYNIQNLGTPTVFTNDAGEALRTATAMRVISGCSIEEVTKGGR